MESLEKSETKVEDKGEPEEAAAEIEAGGRRKEIADETSRNDSGNKRKNIVLTERLGLFFVVYTNNNVIIVVEKVDFL